MSILKIKNGEDWEELISIKGNKGEDGVDGISPVITSSKTGKKTTLTITDGEGTRELAEILDGADGQGSGDMNTAVYDTNVNGIVDNAEKVNNHTVLSDVPANAVFTDTTYSAGTGIDITNGVISNTQTSANWGNITGTLSNQTDLQNALDDKADTSDLADVALSGSYNDLSNKPTIPVVNDATLTIQKNGTTIDTFTANASQNKTVNVSVPTTTNDLINDSNFAVTNADNKFSVGQTISGETVVDSIRTKNMFDINSIIKGYVIASNGAINTAGGYCYCDYIKVKPSTTYTISLTNGNSSDPMRIAEYTSTKTFIDRPITDGNAPWTFTTPANCEYIRLSYQYVNSGVLINTNIQVEEGSSATAYSEYQQLSTNKQTIYEGALQGTQSVTLSGVKRYLKVYFTYAKESSAQLITYEIDTNMGKNLVYGSGIGLSSDGSNALNYYISESSYNVTTSLFTHTRAYWLALPNTSNERNLNGGYIVYRIDTYN